MKSTSYHDTLENDEISNGNPTIHTQRSLLQHLPQGAYCNTAKNWRQLVTPAHDSFKKLEKSRRPGMIEYSAATVTTQVQVDRVKDPAVRTLEMHGSTEIINNHQESNTMFFVANSLSKTPTESNSQDTSRKDDPEYLKLFDKKVRGFE